MNVVSKKIAYNHTHSVYTITKSTEMLCLLAVKFEGQNHKPQTLFVYTIYCIYADDTQSSYIANLNACLYKKEIMVIHFNNERMIMHNLNV